MSKIRTTLLNQTSYCTSRNGRLERGVYSCRMPDRTRDQAVSGATYLRGVGGSGAAGGWSGFWQRYTLHQRQHVTKFIIGNTKRQQRKLPRHFVPGRRAKPNIAAFNEALPINTPCYRTKRAKRSKRARESLTLPCESL